MRAEGVRVVTTHRVWQWVQEFHVKHLERHGNTEMHLSHRQPPKHTHTHTNNYVKSKNDDFWFDLPGHW